MKKLHTGAFLATAVALAASPIIGVTNASAAGTVSYRDFGALNRNTLNGVYAHTKVYYRDDTTITVVKAAGNAAVGTQVKTADTTGFNATYIKAGESLTVLIENSTAMDAKGNDVDVLYRVSDVNPWEEGETTNDEGVTTPNAYASLSINKTLYGSSEREHPTNDENYTRTTVKAGDPIIAWNNTHYADSLFTVEFCKKGTYNTTSDSCTAAGLNELAAALWDFDVPNSNRQKDDEGNYVKQDGAYVYTKYGDKLFHGNEGINPQNGNTILYRNNDNALSNVELSNEDNGFSVQNINGASFNGIWFGNSIIATATGINSKWSYRYSGTTCGVGFLFGSAVPYVMPEPTKSVDKESAKVGDEVNYSIVQEVPFNYTGEVDSIAFLNLHSNYDSIPANKGYSAFAITDTFQEGLKMPTAEEVIVKDEKGNDVTANFTVAIEGQKLTVTAKDATAMSLYGHIFTISVKTIVTDTVTISPVENTAKTTFTPAGDTTGQDLNSNTVETGIIRKVTTKHVDDKTGKEIADSTSEDYPQGADYVTSKLKKAPKGYELVKVPANAKGTVADKDIVVIYRYRKIANPKTFDAGTGAFIGIILAGIAGTGLFFGVKHRR